MTWRWHYRMTYTNHCRQFGLRKMHMSQRRREWSQRQCSCKRSSISIKQQRIMSLYIILGFNTWQSSSQVCLYQRLPQGSLTYYYTFVPKNIRNTKEKEKQVRKEVGIHMLFDISMLNISPPGYTFLCVYVCEICLLYEWH